MINLYINPIYDQHVQFSVEDVQGHPFVNAKRVFDGYQFEYKIQRTGYYHFYLSDGAGDKMVFWNIKIYYYSLLFQIIGALCLLVGLFPLFLRLKNWLLK